MSIWDGTKNMLRNVGATLKEKNALVALTGAGIGYCGTVILAIRATEKATKQIDRIEAEEERELTLWERIKTVWSCYIPTACLGVGSTILLCYAGSSYEKQKNAALAAAAISETAFKEFREAVAEKIDSEKLQEVYERAAEKKEEREARDLRIANCDPNEIETFIEPVGMHEFTSTETEIERTMTRLNLSASTSLDGYYSLYDLCYALNCASPGEGYGDKLVWDVSRGLPTIVRYIPRRLTNGKTGKLLVYSTPPHWAELM